MEKIKTMLKALQAKYKLINSKLKMQGIAKVGRYLKSQLVV